MNKYKIDKCEKVVKLLKYLWCKEEILIVDLG